MPPGVHTLIELVVLTAGVLPVGGGLHDEPSEYRSWSLGPWVEPLYPLEGKGRVLHCCVIGGSPEFACATTGCVMEVSDDWRLRCFTKRMVVNQTREMVSKRPITPPTATPIFMEVSAGLLDDIKGTEGVGVGTFPTVDSGRVGDSDAFTILNASAVTTSKYAHAGTVVKGFITFGYLSSNINLCLKFNERNTLGY